jgi:hypothetical protein
LLDKCEVLVLLSRTKVSWVPPSRSLTQKHKTHILPLSYEQILFFLYSIGSAIYTILAAVDLVTDIKCLGFSRIGESENQTENMPMSSVIPSKHSRENRYHDILGRCKLSITGVVICKGGIL